MTSGLHHVTAITACVQANVDFYVGFMGLKLIKRTGGYEDAEQLHLFYGDAVGSPGSVVTFLVWEDGASGRVGHGQAAEIAFAVPPASIGDWLTRAMTARIPVEGPTREFGEPVLRLKDPDGVIIKLVGAALPAAAPLSDPIAPTRLRAVTLFTEKPEETADFVARFGYRRGPVEGAVQRMISDTDVVDVRAVTGYVPGVPGAGTIDHTAFRALDVDAVRAMRLSLGKANGVTNVHDRQYFLSLYVRDPAGLLMEYATDAPGYTADEPLETLGQALLMPPGDAARAEDLKVMLPQFALPGEPRLPHRDLPFVHRFHTPEDPDGSVTILLHGTGGNEADLMPLAHRLNPRTTLLGARGRATEEGVNRWFRRFDPTRYDQADIRAEAEAFAAFVDGAIGGYGLDSERLTFLGFSNGANLLGAVLQLHPGLVRRAILIRAIQVLETPPAADLAGTRVLLLTGAHDPFAEMAAGLETALRQDGAELDARIIEAGHALAPDDLAAARDWLSTVEP